MHVIIFHQKIFSQRLATPDGEILFDFSKNIINQEIMHALFKLV
jgi:hypothetical protein